MKLFIAAALIVLAAGISLPTCAAEHPELTTPAGQSLSLSGFEGKAVLVNFWATWCGPCRKEMPELDSLAQRLDPEKAVVLGIAADEPAAVDRFLTEITLSYPIATGDPDQMFAWSSQLGNQIQVLPFSVLLNNRGEITWSKMGELDFAELEPVMDEFLVGEVLEETLQRSNPDRAAQGGH